MDDKMERLIAQVLVETSVAGKIANREELKDIAEDLLGQTHNLRMVVRNVEMQRADMMFGSCANHTPVDLDYEVLRWFHDFLTEVNTRARELNKLMDKERKVMFEIERNSE